MIPRLAVLALIVTTGGAFPAWADDTPPSPSSEAVTIQLVHPGAQLQQILALFEGARAPSPAAALAAWRHATGRHDALGKAAQAGIALLNPAMVPELEALDGTLARLGPAAAGAGLAWSAILPPDDGTFRSLTTALALTEGGPAEPLGYNEVDRLGPGPNAPLATTDGVGRLILAADRASLEAALTAPAPPIDPARPAVKSGWLVHVDPARLPTSGASIPLRRLGAALDALNCQAVETVFAVEGDQLEATCHSRFRAAAPGAASQPIDRRWLDWIPRDRTDAALVLALDPAGWDQLFAVADRVEKVDPSHASAGPLRARFNLAALAYGLQPEADLWPLLSGLTLAVQLDPTTGRPTAGAIVLFARDEPAAQRLWSRTITRLIAKRGGPKLDPTHDGGRITFGPIEGQPLEAERKGQAVLLGWGPGWLDAMQRAQADPRQSAAAELAQGWNLLPAPPQRLGALWPRRLPGLTPGPLAQTLSTAPPILWAGAALPEETRDIVAWSGLAHSVHDFLERIPQAPPGTGPF